MHHIRRNHHRLITSLENTLLPIDSDFDAALEHRHVLTMLHVPVQRHRKDIIAGLALDDNLCGPAGE